MTQTFCSSKSALLERVSAHLKENKQTKKRRIKFYIKKKKKKSLLLAAASSCRILQKHIT